MGIGRDLLDTANLVSRHFDFDWRRVLLDILEVRAFFVFVFEDLCAFVNTYYHFAFLDRRYHWCSRLRNTLDGLMTLMKGGW